MIDTCYLSKDEKSFFVSTVEGKVIVYNLPSFQQTTTLDYKNVNDQRFSIDRDEHFVLVSNSQGVFRTACPISTKNPVIISNNINRQNTVYLSKSVFKTVSCKLLTLTLIFREGTFL